MPSALRRGTTLFAGLITALSSTATWAQTSAESPDKYQWLEDVSGERSMAWVKAENARTAKVLESDPHFASLEAKALEVLESPDRLPIPDFREGEIYNVWQDAEHVRGILRRTSLPDYLSTKPTWQTVLDYDALAKKDNESWVQEGLECLYPGDRLCMVALSAGGEDAVTLREFDLKTSRFVDGGFVLPKSKQDVTWVDQNTLLVSRDWGAGTLTQSGYPFIVKLWKRGQPLDEAKEVFRGKETDESAGGISLNDADGHHAILINRNLNFFESEFSLLTSNGVKRIGLPSKAEIEGLVNDQVIVTINEDWKPEGQDKTLVQGSVVSLDLESIKKDPLHLRPAVVFAPTAVEFAQQVAVTKNHLLLTTLENVQGRAYVYTRGANHEWTSKKLEVPDNLTVSIVTASISDDKFFLSTAGFLTPSSYLLGDAAAGTLQEAKTLPPQFDASKDVVEQLQAVSKDGTKIPYFVVHPRDMKYGGENPTLMTAYGGFQISETPRYTPIVGKLWLERGGVFVLANIRGGGEFGPAWHEAGLKTHRQRIYDDFAAVGQDLFTRKIT